MKQGDQFDHKQWQESETGKPLRCEVTKVSRGMVYYRPIYSDGHRGKSSGFAVEHENRYVGRRRNPLAHGNIEDQLRGALKHANRNITSLCSTVNNLAAKLGLGRKVHAEDWVINEP